jgi:hypothetical protein
VAERVGRTVAELEATMDCREYVMWLEHIRLDREESLGTGRPARRQQTWEEQYDLMSKILG